MTYICEKCEKESNDEMIIKLEINFNTNENGKLKKILNNTVLNYGNVFKLRLCLDCYDNLMEELIKINENTNLISNI
jgi:hypothetical protein